MKEAGAVAAAVLPPLHSITEQIACHAAADSSRVAVVDGDRRLSRGDLERETNRLAAFLQHAGAQPGRCVGIFLERSADFVVAALAVLKTGAAYLPLDPATPPKRASLIFADADVAVVLTHSVAAGRLEPPWPLIEIDRLYKRNETPLRSVEIAPQSLAYIIYTSGSTGRPKGVEITHANLGNLIAWHQTAFAVTPADRASQVAGLGFDAAVWEIWPHLAAGATLHIADEVTRRSPEMLRDWLVAERITIGFVPTALAEQLFRMDWPPHTDLRLLLTGGETLHRLPPSDLPFLLVNNYGPTECTVVASSGIVAPETAVGKPSIGRPIANATAFILDENLRQVKNGEPGELCIGGAVVGRGYHNMPALTAKQFIPYIAASGEAVRLYRTGDRARVLPDGELEFLGRVDDQVKMRGYRIELGEIEACLRRARGVLAGTVAMREVAAGTALVAYVVVDPDIQLTEPQLREDLAQHLPDYMLPGFFVSLGALPVKANGKVDRSALPMPCAENLLENGHAAESASNDLEQRIAELVGALLSRPVIEAHENFFMIGGHSMLGAQLVARIREEFGIQLPLRSIFTAPTVRELSSAVARMINAR